MNFIYYVCPDDNSPTGGIKVLYRHVDILNRNGFQAAVVHKRKGFRCTWFENSTRIEYDGRFKADRFDYVVVPEVFGPHATAVHAPARKVIFNQNAYLTFTAYPLDARDMATAYRDPDLAATMVVSEDSRRYLEYVFPDLKIVQIRNSVDAQTFRFRPLNEKKMQIAFMGRKQTEDARQVINIVKFHNLLEGWEVRNIHNLSEQQVAEVLGESVIFLSFGYPEGFSLPPMEAMLSGCLVIGYHGSGGREYFLPEFSWPVEAGDIIGFARAVEQVILRLHREPQALAARTVAAREFVLEQYSQEREEHDIVHFWDALMFEHGHDAIAEEPA
jgi:glycosyltransferase involved in cell wall biosynthesis